MTSLYNAANLLHSVLVLLFVAITGLLMMVSIVRRSRLRRIRLSWGNGRLFGLPLIPTAFLTIVVGLIGVELAVDGAGTSLGWVTLLGYLTGGVFWYIGTVLQTSVVVTDWGLSRRCRGETETLPWHEVTDYLANDHGRTTTYIFFRVDDRGMKQRFDLKVPAGCRARFRETVESKLDARFNYYIRRQVSRPQSASSK